MRQTVVYWKYTTGQGLGFHGLHDSRFGAGGEGFFGVRPGLRVARRAAGFAQGGRALGMHLNSFGTGICAAPAKSNQGQTRRKIPATKPFLHATKPFPAATKVFPAGIGLRAVRIAPFPGVTKPFPVATKLRAATTKLSLHGTRLFPAGLVLRGAGKRLRAQEKSHILSVAK